MCAAVAVALLPRVSRAGAPAVGDQAPEIAAKEWFNTPPLSLASLRGKIVVVEFWATWCPPCRASIPHLVELHNKYSGKGVAIIGLTDEPPAKIKPFVSTMGMTYAVGAGSTTGALYGVRAIPRAFIVDPQGRVAWTGHPMSMDAALEQALRETPPVLAAPDELARARKSLEEAARLIKERRYGRAAAIVAELGRQDLPAELKDLAGKLAAELEAAGSTKMEEARRLAGSDKSAEALKICAEVLREFPGSAAAKEAEALRARLGDEAGVLRPAQTAPAPSGPEQKAEALLAMARNWMRAGEKQKARDLLEKLLKEFPETKAARAAQEELEGQ